ncbi:DUF4262 domain-containing protein [Nonomuraea mangrovi]|uniref:DUF4262 domain-containing protein n=2 Tax=Nonomuraea TaxID=83681 RepID=A0ABW4T3M2_9ACTN
MQASNTRGTPDLIMCGLDLDLMHECLNILGEAERAPAPEQRRDDVLEGHAVFVKTVDPSWHPILLGSTSSFYQHAPMEVLQVVWPKALTRGRLTGADYAYFHLGGLRAASALLVETQGKIGIAGDWGGGHAASADGMRFAVPLRSIHTRPNRKYFGSGRGATWLNVVSDRVMGLGGIVMPGTLRDSLGISDAVFNLDGPARPEIVITDTASYSDLVLGLFSICGYQCSPRIADISDARLWRFDLGADYGPLEPVSRQRIQAERISAHWEDMLRVAGTSWPSAWPPPVCKSSSRPR